MIRLRIWAGFSQNKLVTLEQLQKEVLFYFNEKSALKGQIGSHVGLRIKQSGNNSVLLDNAKYVSIESPDKPLNHIFTSYVECVFILHQLLPNDTPSEDFEKKIQLID